MMRNPATLLALLLASPASLGFGASGAPEDESGCIVCHGAEAQAFTGTVHARGGLTCVDCHGGDATVFETDPAHSGAFLALTDPVQAIESCADCHSDEERMRGTELHVDEAAIYWTSAHGRALRERGDQGVATCVTCHGSHGIYAREDPRSPVHKFRQAQTCGECHADAQRMEPYGLDHDVVGEYVNSVHGVALLKENRLSSPACTDCHGSHGATPPRVEMIDRVCGHCHSVVREYFEQGPHLAPSLAGEMEECVSCHGAHDIALSSVEAFAGEGMGSCTICHGEGEGPALAVAADLHAGIKGLDDAIAAAEASVQAAAARGVLMEREHGYLDDARSLRSRVRPVTHALAPERLDDLLNRGHGMVAQTNESLATKARVLRDRKIFTAIFLGVTVLLAVVLQTYRREAYGPMRARRRRDAPTPQPPARD